MAGSYYNVVEIAAATKNLATNYPTLCSEIPLPNTTAEGRPCSALRISSGYGHPKGTLLILGGTHGREWGSAEIALGFAADLLLAFKRKRGVSYGRKAFASGAIQGILRDIDVVLFPLVNPDGLNFSHTTDGDTVGGWRKNRRSIGSSIGVDVNRNFEFLWDFRTKMTQDVWTSDDPNDEFFYGTGPFSEAESNNVKFLLEGIRDVRWLVDIHSASQTILYSWGSGTNDSSDPTKSFLNPMWDGLRGDSALGYTEYIPAADLTSAISLSNAMKAAIFAVRGTSYNVQQSFDLYAVSGTADDYAYSRQWQMCAPKVQPFVIEFGKQFRPVWTEMIGIIADVSAALFAFCDAARAQARSPASC